MSNEPISREAKLLIQLGEMGNELHHWKRECLEQARLLAMSADREEKLRSKILMQAKVYRGEDLRDNSRWSIFNEGRAQALEKLADETWP